MVRLPQMGHSRGSSRSGIAPVPASVLLSASGSAIKRIKAGVKACLSTAPCQVMDSLEGLHPPGKSITNEKRILLSDASRARLYGLAGIKGLPGRVGQIHFNESRILRPTGRDAESAGGLPKAISGAFGLHQRQPSSTRSMAYPHFMLASSPQFDASYFTSSPASRRSQDVKRVAAHFC